MEPLLTLEQVAEVLQVSTKTVLRLIDRGELTGVKVGKAWRFTREDLQLYIDSQRSGGEVVSKREIEQKLAEKQEELKRLDEQGEDVAG